MRLRTDAPEELVEEARGYVPAGDDMSEAEFVRYILRRYIEDRRLEQLRAASGGDRDT